MDVSEIPPADLHDQRDREELRRRYYGLLQELRVLLPGVQLLAAFLLTVPFAQRFSELDHTERVLFLVALGSAIVSILGFVTPIVLHRFGRRTERSVRLLTGIRAARIGLVALVVSLATSTAVVCLFVFDEATTVGVLTALTVSTIALWVALPAWSRRSRAAVVHPADDPPRGG